MIKVYDESKYPITRQQFTRLLKDGNPTKISEGIARLVCHDPELPWAQEMCLRLLKDPSPAVMADAALSLVYLAKKHGRIDAARALPLLKRLRSIPDVGTAIPNYAISVIQKYSSSKSTNSG